MLARTRIRQTARVTLTRPTMPIAASRRLRQTASRMRAIPDSRAATMISRCIRARTRSRSARSVRRFLARRSTASRHRRMERRTRSPSRWRAAQASLPAKVLPMGRRSTRARSRCRTPSARRMMSAPIRHRSRMPVRRLSMVQIIQSASKARTRVSMASLWQMVMASRTRTTTSSSRRAAIPSQSVLSRS